MHLPASSRPSFSSSKDVKHERNTALDVSHRDLSSAPFIYLLNEKFISILLFYVCGIYRGDFAFRYIKLILHAYEIVHESRYIYTYAYMQKC